MKVQRMGLIPSRTSPLTISEEGGAVRIRADVAGAPKGLHLRAVLPPEHVVLAVFALDGEGDAEDVLLVRVDAETAARLGGDLIAAARDAGLALDAHREGRRAYRGEV